MWDRHKISVFILMQSQQEFRETRNELVSKLNELDKFIIEVISHHLQIVSEKLDSIVLFLRKITQPPLTVGIPPEHLKDLEELEDQRSHIKKISRDILDLKEGKKKRFMTNNLMKILGSLKDSSQSGFRKLLLKSDKRELFLLEWFDENVENDYLKYKKSADSVLEYIAKLGIKSNGFPEDLEKIKADNAIIANSFGIVVEVCRETRKKVEEKFEETLKKIS